jgi:cytochrome P450
VNLIGNGTLALLRNRDQLERLVADPTLDSNAVDELLRYDSPVQLSRRVVLEPTVLGENTVGAGELVITALGSANHDPARFGDSADDLDLGRADAADHLAFGSGIHHCLGAALARLEGSIAVPRLLRRFPELEAVSAAADWNGRMVLRGQETLRVALNA